VELVAELAQGQVTVGELLRLRAGDFIPLPLKEVIPAKIDGVPVMECRFGAVNGHTAIRIERLLKYSRYTETTGMGGLE
jgi:flagellar motor switch protein FliM